MQRLKRLDEALLTFDKVLAIDPNVVEAHYNRPIGVQHYRFRELRDDLAHNADALGFENG